MIEVQHQLSEALNKLSNSLSGDFHFNEMMRTLYATDASQYKELPLAVAIPKTVADIKAIIAFAQKNKISIIPRAAGTSLAGQCVGNGIVIDISKHFNNIIEFNAKEGWVKVEPGVIRAQLNDFLKPYGYFFSPITSTANRAMIGGMVGNNSCGTTSITYGSTRDHVLSLDVILSDGAEVQFSEISNKQFEEKRKQANLEGRIYQHIYDELSQEQIRDEVKNNFPKVSVQRRNTGYAVDYLINTRPFSASSQAFNFCKLLTGSEGTLGFTTGIKLHVDPLPDPYDLVIAVHFSSVLESMRGAQTAMTFAPTACELMDKTILDCTKENSKQLKNRSFVEGDPEAVLLIEIRGKAEDEAVAKAEEIISKLKAQKLGYAYPTVHTPKTKSVWELRSAGLGLLSNLPGDEKATTCIEDTAVALEDLEDYVADFEEMLGKFGQKSIYYAHAGAGELHLRPILNLKKKEDIEQFRAISLASAKLVKKYRGSISGEHGDGRLRAEFIPMMVGEANYQLFKRIKATWDPNNIFNPGKIVDAPAMDTSLRYKPGQLTPAYDTAFDFSRTQGLLRMAEKCTGSGDCRKLPASGGTMCPSYRATRNEKDSTRGRANVLREFLNKKTSPNPFDHAEIKSVMDLCISCKGCTSECPSNVDMSTLKAEFLHQYYQSHSIPLRSRAFANIAKINELGALLPSVTNFFLRNKLTGKIIKNLLKVASKRSLPQLHVTTLRKWHAQNGNKIRTKNESIRQKVYLFCDEFTNFNDTTIGIQSIELLNYLGYEAVLVEHPESGRAALSKGILAKAKSLAVTNVTIFTQIINQTTPLLGIEPSAILSFRDEYPRLVPKELQDDAQELSQHVFLIDEFIQQEIKIGNISSDQFDSTLRTILLHGHCHQKALSSIEDTVWMLSLPKGHSVEVIPSGCCGMAGSFGYEKEHYETSMQIGDLVLFPAIQKAKATTLIAAPGTSCRHQIYDGTQRKALHPVEILWKSRLSK